MTPEQIAELADDLGIAPREVAAAVALMRAGRSDLIVEVMNRRMTVRAALTAARKPYSADGGRDA